MNKSVFKQIGILVIFLVFFIPTTVFAGTINVVVDGSKVNFLSDPVIENGATLVPMRQIFEALGATVKWDQASKQITSTINNNYVALTVGANVANLNGTNVSLTVAPEIISGSTYVPIRFIAESTGAYVQWDNQSNTVRITTDKGPYSDWPLYSTSNLEGLTSDLLDGRVVYYNGQYHCSPSYFQSISKVAKEAEEATQAPRTYRGIAPDAVVIIQDDDDDEDDDYDDDEDE